MINHPHWRLVTEWFIKNDIREFYDYLLTINILWQPKKCVESQRWYCYILIFTIFLCLAKCIWRDRSKVSSLINIFYRNCHKYKLFCVLSQRFENIYVENVLNPFQQSKIYRYLDDNKVHFINKRLLLPYFFYNYYEAFI